MTMLIAGLLAALLCVEVAFSSEIFVRQLAHKGRCYKRPSFGSVLGKGGQGVVYRAHPSTEKHMTVAMKKVATGKSFTDAEIEFLQTFCDSDSYRGVPRLFDLIKVSDENVFIIEQYFKGKTIDHISFDLVYSRSDVQIWEARVMDVLYKVTTILNEIHRSGYVHGDLKPDNILYDGHDNVMIIDWGSCGKISTEDMRSTEFSPANGKTIMSTREFSAPELKGFRIGFPNDIYSLGKTAVVILGKFDRSQFRRLAQFIRLTLKEQPQHRLTADELLRHAVFQSERLHYGSIDENELPSFERVINLEGSSNERWFHEFPLPQEDDSSSSNSKFSGLRRCFSVV